VRRFLSLRSRIALFGGLLVFLTVFAFAEGVLGLVQLGQQNATDKSLRDRAVPVAGWVAGAAPGQLSAPQQYLAPADLRSGTDVFAEVISPDGSVLFSTALDRGSPPHPPAALLASAAGHEAYLYSYPYQFYARKWSRPDLGLSGYIVTGQSRQAAIDGLAGVRGFLIVSGIFTIAGGLVATGLLDRDGTGVTLAATNGLDRGQVGKVSLAWGQGITGRVAASRQPIAVEDVTRDDRFAWVRGFDMEGLRGMLSVPLVWHDRVVGALNVQTREARRFDDGEIVFLQTIAALLAGIVEKGRLTAEVEARLAQLTALDAARSELMSVVTHELRTPLSIVRVYVDLLAEAADDEEANPAAS